MDRRAGMLIVDEHDTMPDEAVVRDRDALADEAMRGDFAACANFRSALYFHKRPILVSSPIRIFFAPRQYI